MRYSHIVSQNATKQTPTSPRLPETATQHLAYTLQKTRLYFILCLLIIFCHAKGGTSFVEGGVFFDEDYIGADFGEAESIFLFFVWRAVRGIEENSEMRSLKIMSPDFIQFLTFPNSLTRLLAPGVEGNSSCNWKDDFENRLSFSLFQRQFKAIDKHAEIRNKWEP